MLQLNYFYTKLSEVKLIYWRMRIQFKLCDKLRFKTRVSKQEYTNLQTSMNFYFIVSLTMR